VFNYFSERTPWSFVETRDTSVVWNYKFSDYEFGKSQAQDMLQHLLTGSISNSAVDVVRGSRSVEARPAACAVVSSHSRSWARRCRH
jgi:trehalose 6-phosphate synthase/phosphatase